MLGVIWRGTLSRSDDDGEVIVKQNSKEREQKGSEKKVREKKVRETRGETLIILSCPHVANLEEVG